jgi:hypothetical protein
VKPMLSARCSTERRTEGGNCTLPAYGELSGPCGVYLGGG